MPNICSCEPHYFCRILITCFPVRGLFPHRFSGLRLNAILPLVFSILKDSAPSRPVHATSSGACLRSCVFACVRMCVLAPVSPLSSFFLCAYFYTSTTTQMAVSNYEPVFTCSIFPAFLSIYNFLFLSLFEFMVVSAPFLSIFPRTIRGFV